MDRGIRPETADVIAHGEGHHGDPDLGGPNEVGRAEVGREHFGAEDLDDHDGRAVDEGGEVGTAAVRCSGWERMGMGTPRAKRAGEWDRLRPRKTGEQRVADERK